MRATMKATQERLKQAAEWGEKLSALLDEAEQNDIDMRMVRAILKDARDQVNETITERSVKDEHQ